MERLAVGHRVAREVGRDANAIDIAALLDQITARSIAAQATAADHFPPTTITRLASLHPIAV